MALLFIDNSVCGYPYALALCVQASCILSMLFTHNEFFWKKRLTLMNTIIIYTSHHTKYPHSNPKALRRTLPNSIGNR